MARIELTQSGVIFNEELHEYWLDGKQLSGITEALRKQLHPDMYSSIPKRILEQAAEYGTSPTITSALKSCCAVFLACA